MIEPYKAKTITSLKKASSHLIKVINMVEDDKYCTDIMHQVLAISGYLKSSNALILQSHLHTCGKDNLATKDKDKKEKFIKEIIRACDVANR